MKPSRVGDGERSLAVFIDFENMGLGFNNRRDRFEIGKVLERLVEKGKIVAKKAYADWSRFGMYTAGLHEAAIELVEIPRRGVSGKNSADIRLVVDAIDLAYSKDHIDTFVIVSGDSDFSPLVSKLKELGKHVIGLGLAEATSDLLRDNCDEFIYYEDLDRAPIIPIAVNEQIPDKKRKAFALLLDSLLALRRENKEVIYASMVKDTMKRKKPSFNEEYHGYRTFSELLEDAQKEGLVDLEKHKTSGMYIVSRFGLEKKGGTSAGAAAPAPKIARLPEKKEPAGDSGRSREGERGRGRGGPARGGSQAKSASAAAAEEASAPDERPLGRELVEEIDLEDEGDLVPSYGRAKPATARPAVPPAKPARPAGQQPKQPGTQPSRSSQQPKASGQGKPRAEGEQSRRGGRGRGGSRRKAAEPESPPARQAPPPKPAPAPSRPNEDDDFGAGLD
jgi:uncharacterized protein (TIGR00288 family)